MKTNSKQQKGFTIVEVIVCIAIILIIFLGFLELAGYNLRIQEQSKRKLEALSSLSETIEAVQSIRYEDWNIISGFSNGTNYYPEISEDKWILNAGTETINNYTRWVVFETVYRDDNDDISSSGVEDTETRKVTAYIEWDDRGTTRQLDLVTYITNWAN